MKKWTEGKAIAYLTKGGAKIQKKIIFASEGLQGLTLCSALDYLINNCGYKTELCQYFDGKTDKRK